MKSFCYKFQKVEKSSCCLQGTQQEISVIKFDSLSEQQTIYVRFIIRRKISKQSINPIARTMAKWWPLWQGQGQNHYLQFKKTLIQPFLLPSCCVCPTKSTMTDTIIICSYKPSKLDNTANNSDNSI